MARTRLILILGASATAFAVGLVAALAMPGSTATASPTNPPTSTFGGGGSSPPPPPPPTQTYTSTVTTVVTKPVVVKPKPKPKPKPVPAAPSIVTVPALAADHVAQSVTDLVSAAAKKVPEAPGGSSLLSPSYTLLLLVPGVTLLVAAVALAYVLTRNARLRRQEFLDPPGGYLR